MALTLTVRSGKRPAPSLTLDLPKLLIGRSHGCDLVLPDPSVSQRHASVRQRGSDYIVLDEGSSNGTFVGPVRLSEGTPRVLKSGDLLRLGRVWVEVTIEQAAPSPNPRDLTKEIALRLVEGAMFAEDGNDALPKVRVRGGPDEGKLLALEHFNAPYVIGRGKRCDLVLVDDDCSRRHIEVIRRGMSIRVRDLGSKNGASLDEEALGDQESNWTPGRIARIGKTELELLDPVGATMAELEGAADEVVAGSVDPPEVAEIPDATQVSRGSQRAPPERLTAARVARPPSERPPASAPARSSWGAVDFAILLVALAVIALSVGGLVWLF